MSRWPLVKLGDVLEPVQRPEIVDPASEYRLLGVRLEGRGPFMRETLSGAESSAKTLYRVRTGEFIYSRLFAWRGAFGVVSEQLDGCCVSNEFPVYVSPNGIVDLDYLNYWFRLPDVLERVAADCTGSTPLTRNRYKERYFLELRLPLPPIEEQQRIVMKLTGLARAREHSQTLRMRVASDLKALHGSVLRQAFDALSQSPRPTISDLCTEIVDCLHSNPVYSEEGVPTVRSPDVGWGELMLDTARRTSESEYQRRIQRSEPRPGDIVLVREGGGAGKAGLINDGQRLSLGQRVMLLRPDGTKILPRFLLLQWLSPLIQDDQIGPRLKGSASPHLNIGALKRFRVVCPDIEDQQAVVDRLESLTGRLRIAHALLRETQTLADALVSSSLHSLMS